MMNSIIGTKENSSPGKNIQENLIREQSKDVFKKYELLGRLGHGSMGAVSVVRIREHKIGGSAFKKKGLLSKAFGRKQAGIKDKSERRKVEALYALKTIILDRICKVLVKELENEIDILKSTDHPNIVRAHEVFYRGNQIYLILDLCEGGNLYSCAPYSEQRAARISKEIVSAVQFMHNHAIVHRDLKFENIMFASNDPNSPIKILDFGLAKKFASGKQSYMEDGVGTVYTMAPEVIEGVYTAQADLWSIGVIVFMLLSGEKPFWHRKMKNMIKIVLKGEYKMDSPVWNTITPDGQDFVKQLLDVNPAERMNALEAAHHPWFNRQLSDRRPSEELLQLVDGSLLQYKNVSALKKVALNLIAHKSSTEEMMHLRKAFEMYDKERDGILSLTEFELAMKKSGAYDNETIQQIFESIDVNHNGEINYTEFLAAAMDAAGYIEEERIAEAFDRIDNDDSGKISRKDLETILGENMFTQELIDEILEQTDKDKDGEISYDEFFQTFRGSNRQTSMRSMKLGTK